ncbi:ATP-binding protein [Mesorhizobium sp. B2-6-1]|uniref:AAA family ATPase n=1 Tax=Mesorhizobium sp. B2-6-1 TaxID=2589916 RepID=UPI00112BECB7|nr:ATP-binding protein [Mesorhizobium sp. B2-6-1]TPJ58467.1 chromosome segregation protein SMC [Mesorhizobium sp. B2-6-1]
MNTNFISHLRLKNWRNFRDVDITLQPRAFFIGPNASGKSNILDAFRFLRDLVSVGGGLAEAIRRRGGISHVRCLHGRIPSNVEIEVGIVLDNVQWEYLLSFNQNRSEDRPRIVAERVKNDSTIVLNRDVEIEKSDDPLTLTQTQLEQLSTNKNFRDIYDFFQSIRYSHVVPQIIRDPRRTIDETEDPYGGDLLKRINETPKKRRAARLRRMKEALAIAVPQFEDLDFEVDEAGVPHLMAAYRHWRKNPTKQREETFSDGTLRLLGLLWAIGEEAGPLLLEEPELSLNDAVTNQIPRMLARMQRLTGRQVLITTHSSALLSDKGIGPAEVHILEVTDNGTEVKTASNIPDVRKMYEAGLNLSEASMPLVRPKNIEQLSLF